MNLNLVRLKFVQICFGPHNSGPNLTKFGCGLRFGFGKPNLILISSKFCPKKQKKELFYSFFPVDLMHHQDKN